MGIQIFEVDKDKIQYALEEMNQTHDGMKNEVVHVREKTMHYDVYVNTDNDYPFVINRWRNNEFHDEQYAEFPHKEEEHKTISLRFQNKTFKIPQPKRSIVVDEHKSQIVVDGVVHVAVGLD